MKRFFPKVPIGSLQKIPCPFGASSLFLFESPLEGTEPLREENEMKKSVVSVFSILFVLVLAVNATADSIPVEVISNNSHVWGSYSGSYGIATTPPGGMAAVSDNYDSQGTAPQNGDISTSPPVPPMWLTSRADMFSVATDASAPFEFMFPFARAYAQTDTIFRPLNNFSTLPFSFQAHQEMYVTFDGELVDLTSNQVIR